MAKVYVIIAACFLFLFAACKDQLIIPPVYHQTVFLDTVLVEPTEVDLHLATSDSVHSGSTLFQIRRDSVIIFSRVVQQKDTVIVDTGLLPSHVYRYKALRFTDSVKTDSSKPLSLRTMDTTSHDFTWEVDTIGDGNNSILRDVAIVNDTLVYAVGEFYLRDSTGQFDPLLYNLAKWNGREWSLRRVSIPFRGFTITPALYGIFAFSQNQIWLTGGLAIYGDGNNWTTCDVRLITGFDSLSFTKCWGATPSDMYFVGLHGGIAHYDGTTWQKQESSTDVDLTDVCGSPDGSIVWTCGFKECCPGTFLFRNIGNGWQLVRDGSSLEFTIKSDSLSGTFTSIYANSSKKVYVCSSAGIYEASSKTIGEAKRLSFTSSWFPGFPNRLRGNGVNDFAIVGDYAMIAHYNGSTWRYFSQLRGDNERLTGLSQSGNLVVAVGIITDPINSHGLVFIGRR